MRPRHKAAEIVFVLGPYLADRDGFNEAAA